MLFKNNNFLCLSEGMGVSPGVFNEKKSWYIILMFHSFSHFFIGFNIECRKFRTLQNMFLFRHVFFVIYQFHRQADTAAAVGEDAWFFCCFLSYCNTNVCLSNVLFRIVFSRLFQHIIFLKKMRKKYCKKFWNML